MKMGGEQGPTIYATIPTLVIRRFALVVDDDPASTEILSRLLAEEHYHAVSAGSAEEALEQLKTARFDVIFLDVNLPGKSGVQALPSILDSAGRTPVLMVSAYGQVPTVVEAMQRGARDFMEKPVDPQRLRERLRSFEAAQASPHASRFGMVGHSAAIERLLEQLRTVAATSAPVLLVGPSGSGKELAARAIHIISANASGPFLAVNAAAISPALLESELFGHEKGAFTGADGTREGYFRAASGGTLFLDEIGDLPLELQVKLLRVLQEKEVIPVGSTKAVSVNARLVLATHQDLAAMVKAGRFREDLYYRISSLTVRLPPLTQRQEDLGDLARFFAAAFARENDKPIPAVSDELVEAMKTYSWPGNIRELRQVVERSVLFTKGAVMDTLELLDGTVLGPGKMSARLGAQMAQDPTRVGIKAARDELAREAERTAIQEALRQSGGNMSQAARLLKVDRTTLYRMLKRHDME